MAENNRDLASYDAGYSDGRKDGYSDGHDDGLEKGFDEGYREGCNNLIRALHKGLPVTKNTKSETNE